MEMIATVGIFATLLAIKLYNYNQFSLKRGVENDTYKIYTFANKDRTSTFTEKTDYYIPLNDSKTLLLDNNNDNSIVLETLALPREFNLSKLSYNFNNNGFIEDVESINSVDPPDFQFNCVKMYASRG